MEQEYSDDGPIPTVHKNYPEPDMNPFKAHAADDDEASIASSVEEDHILPIGDMEGNPVHYPGEEKDEHHHKVRI
jgi:hypothetical protein